MIRCLLIFFTLKHCRLERRNQEALFQIKALSLLDRGGGQLVCFFAEVRLIYSVFVGLMLAIENVM